MDRFREQNSQLMFRGDLVQAQMPILHRFMSEVLPDVNVLGALASDEDSATGRWNWRRRRRCRTRASDDRGERLQPLQVLQLGQGPVLRQRTSAVSDDRPCMRVQAKRSLYGAKPGRLIVAG